MGRPRAFRRLRRRQLEARGERRGRVAADPHVERRGVDDPVVRRRVPVAQLGGAGREPHGPRLAWLERDALEALELADGTRSRAVTLVDVELDDLVARARSDVR